jgi:hypothetical protein
MKGGVAGDDFILLREMKRGAAARELETRAQASRAARALGPNAVRPYMAI